MSKKTEAEQYESEWKEERNKDPHLLLKQKAITGNLKRDHDKITTDINVAESRIKDL